MKTSYLKHISVLCLLTILSLSSCLKDDRYFNPAATASYVAEFPLSGIANFSADAITDAGPTITKQFVVDIASINAPTTATTVTIGVDNSLIAPYLTTYPAISYVAVPTTAYTFPDVTVTIPAGSRQATLTVTFDKSKLDPSLSYMLPIVIKSAPGVTISGNYGVHYYHFIGNDFAGTYVWEYRRYNNGTGPGANAIPSKGQGTAPDTYTPNTNGKISPVSPTEFTMETGYNGNHVMYDVTFTKTVTNGVATYSNWAVKFDAANIAIWTAAGITNTVAPKFTIPPPATATDPKIFEMNYVSGGALPRYIDDTYHK